MLVTTDRRKPIGRLAVGAATGWKAADCPTCDDDQVAPAPTSTIRGYQKARRKRRMDSTLRPVTSPLTPDEQRVERAVTTGIRQARDSVRSERLREAIRMRSTDEIVASVPLEPLRGIMRPVDTVFRDRMVWAATGQGRDLGVRRTFAVVDPEVIRYAGLQSGALVQRITNEQLASLRGAIVDAVAGQFTVDDTAKIIRSSIGLTDRYRNAVTKNYVGVKQAALLMGASESAAADRAERAASRYADKLVRSRARTIARTEVNTAQNYGKQVGWEAAYGEGAVAPDAMKEWRIANGACDICAPYAGIRVPVMQPFPTGDLMPPAHPNCRCTADIVSPVRDIIQRLEQEDAAAARSADETLEGVQTYKGQVLRTPSNAQGDVDLYGQDSANAARQWRDKMVIAEPNITRDIIDLGADFGARPVGLDFRLKSEDSLTRKIASDVNESRIAGVSRTATEAASSISDTIRYTYTLGDDEYAAGTQRVLAALSDKGYELRVKNYWQEGNTYKGINVAMKDPNGVPVELQFHTPESLRVKEGELHQIYERQRVLTNRSQIEVLNGEMRDAAGRIPTPRGDLSFGEQIRKSALQLLRKLRRDTLAEPRRTGSKGL